MPVEGPSVHEVDQDSPYLYRFVGPLQHRPNLMAGGATSRASGNKRVGAIGLRRSSDEVQVGDDHDYDEPIGSQYLKEWDGSLTKNKKRGFGWMGASPASVVEGAAFP